MDFASKQSLHPEDSAYAQILLNCQGRLESMRAMVLFDMSQSAITQLNIEILERDLSDIIKQLDQLRRVPNIDEFHTSLGEVQSSVRMARRCLLVASGLSEKARTPRYMDALYQKYDEFCDLLDEAIELLDRGWGTPDKTAKGTVIVESSEVQRMRESLPALSAIAHVTLEEGDKAQVGNIYSVEAGVSWDKLEEARNTTFDIWLLTNENLKPTTKWYKRLTSSRLNIDSPLIKFAFKVLTPGQGSVALDFYHSRWWLRTVRFQFECIEKS